ncbi:BFD-like [2Fe-2S] binding domain-containing protein [Lentibacillus halodurans]|uniref:BFD-like [2Fe-2S] binding domain-containing protein n=1 Tax=Lentibacillus halodurans TaxID=237679 RepID=A0A1I1AKP4_9BACI|nr:(2Fe-2S)-binding protein [Lentibacillus halodurans]SFB38611.1 BFD-like [2Fe-2S] binding domain-containing protein [Lentibacillus halodurans]
MDKSTIVCRCEEINIDEIESAINLGARTFNDIKRLTRCGMGPCQAKCCMNLVRQIISDKTGQPLHEIRPPRMRVPLGVTRMGALAGSQASSVTSVFGESTEEGETVHEEKL